MPLCQKVISAIEVFGSQWVDEKQTSQPVESPLKETALEAFTSDLLQVRLGKHGMFTAIASKSGITARASASVQKNLSF